MDPAKQAIDILARYTAGEADTAITAVGVSKEWVDTDLDTISASPLPLLDLPTLGDLVDYMVGEMLSPSPVELPETVLVLAAHVTSPLLGTQKKPRMMLEKYLHSVEAAKEVYANVTSIKQRFIAHLLPEGAKVEAISCKDRADLLSIYYSAKSAVISEASLKTYLAWYSNASIEDRVEFGCFMAFCALRAVSSKEQTIVKNLGFDPVTASAAQGKGTSVQGGFYVRYRDLYKGRTLPSCGIQAVTLAAVGQIKSSFSTGSMLLCSILVPVLRYHIQKEPPVPQEDQAILRFGLLMTLEYTGIYLADSYIRALARTGESGSTLIPQFYWNIHHSEYQRLLELARTYMKDPQGRVAWRWAKCLHSDYLSEYSGAANPWLCSLFTALFADKEPKQEDTDVWEKFCLKKASEHKEWALKMAKAYWDGKFSGSAIPEDSSLVKQIIGVGKKRPSTTVASEPINFEEVTLFTQ
ncbi:MAG: nucleocapsid protein [Fuyun tick rhabdovirus]|uniref:Nucleoprotein n=1 Tax=Fuyun tick rhabdovirus TaxID=2977134 RepID=A0A977R7T9_9RHAB|nr:MAG: nucleocapsid protein [Fuyun tick rhabdovirus]